MGAKTQREHLGDYTRAARQIELVHVAISVLEPLHGARVLRAIKILQQDQQASLKCLDAAAAKLGAPYPKAFK